MDETREQDIKALGVSALFAVVGMALIVWVSLSPDHADEAVALIFPPGFNEEQSLSALGKTDGVVLRFGATPNVLIAKFNQISFSEIKELTGAIGMLDPRVPGSCLVLE